MAFIGVPSSPSPTEVRNFTIPYSEEQNLIQNLQTDNFLQFLRTGGSQANISNISGTDKNFFPRAFTDLNTFDSESNIESKSMAGRNIGGGFADSFQQDGGMVPNQRHGPEGSPDIVPSGARRFAPSNLSESGELFAPVRTLTFSDIDQSSSHVEDSFFDSSRLVSTPNKNDNENKARIDQFTAYSSMAANRFQTIENNENIGADSDSSESDNIINGMRDTETPEFREMEGERDEELTNTGPFHPSMHGLSKEFMDNFVGKTGNQEAMRENDIFSPLGSNFRMSERKLCSETSPLPSPGKHSPYSRDYPSPKSQQKSPRFQQSPRGKHSPRNQVVNKKETDEIQFAMSPSKDLSNAPSFNREVLGQGKSDEHFYSGNMAYSHSFMQVEKANHSFNPAAIPKNLNEYFEQVTSDQFMGQRFNATNKPGYDNDIEENELASRQGDGSDNEMDEQPQPMLPSPDSDKQNSELTLQPLESKYLQKTQVSVKLPQATYDTISANSPNAERYSPGDYQKSNYLGVSVTSDNGIDKDDLKHGHGEGMDLPKRDVDKSDLDDELLGLNTGKTSNNKPSDRKTNDTNASIGNSDISKSKKSEDMVQNYFNENINTDKSSKTDSKPSEKGQGQNQTVPTSEQSQSSFTGKSNDVTNTSMASQGTTQSQSQVSSRLFQETVSKRNKTTQKFVSSAPVPSKSFPASQNKDFKKPYEPVTAKVNTGLNNPPKKPTNDTAIKKPTPNEPCPKFKASDRTKPKSSSNDSLNQKPKYSGNSSRNTQPSSGENTTQSRLYGSNQNMNSSSSNQGQGQYGRGQFMTKGQSQGQGRSGGEAHNGSMHSDDEGHGQGHGRIVTQVEYTSPVAVEQPRQNRSVRQMPNMGDSSLDIKGMEEVRHQLQSMMKMSYEQMNSQDRSQYEHSDIIAGFGVDMAADQHRPMEKSWNMLRNPGEEDILDNFPSFSSQYFTDSGNISRSDPSVHAENQRLRDMLEKERYRRKHCEQYIQQLNVKLLETQQQVAVAVSTDKRKDLMIEQLDKQLARVMEGWKKRDQEKDDQMSDILKEKEEIENNMKQQQQMISNFEHDMSEAVDALRQEKERAAQDIEELKEKIKLSDHAKQHAEELLDAEKEKSDLIQQECDNLREGRETLDKKLDQMQKRLHREQDEWFQREQELLQRIEEVSEKTNKVLQVERTKNEEQGKLAEEIMEQYQSAVTSVKKLEMELDAALREKESIKVEMGIMEAKFENAQRVLEADLSSTMEKRIAEQISDVQKRHENIVDNLQENHRDQMLELSKKNGKEMEKQLNVFREEMLKKEEDFRKQMQELESRLTEYRNENAELKRSKQKLESTRLEILTKLQYAMQTQWNEALSMLSSTPQAMRTQSRTGHAGDDNITLQGPPTVNFSFLNPDASLSNQNSLFQPPASIAPPTNPSANQTSPPRIQPTNQMTPPRQSANQATPPRQTARSLANQISPVPRHVSNQHGVIMSSPGGESVISHSTERDPADHVDHSVETAAMSHLKQFQDYMNSFANAKTPDWISSMTSQSEAFNASLMSQNSAYAPPQQPPPLTSPSEIASFLSSHLQTIQQQHLMTSHPTSSASHPTSSSTSNSLPYTCVPNHKENESASSYSLPANLHHTTQPKSLHSSVADNSKHKMPNSSRNLVDMSESCLSQSDVTTSKLDNQSQYSMYSGRDYDMHRGGATGVARAVALHPPQQGEDPYKRDDHENTRADVLKGYFHGGQSFSPPTKENKDSQHNSNEDLTNQSNSHIFRLNEDYSQLSERLEQHGSHQQELQYYIQMLLHKSPGETTAQETNDSMYSQDNVELDLNDSQQAAQLQVELDRIQQLREKQQDTSKGSSGSNKSQPTGANLADGDSERKILTQEQLAEVTKLLNNVKGQGHTQTEHPQVLELLELLKHANINPGNQSQVKKGTRPAGRGHGGHASHHGDKHRPGQPAIKRNVQFNPGKGVDHSKSHGSEANKDKTGAKGAQQKKVERKVAGSATKGDKTPKTGIWK